MKPYKGGGYSFAALLPDEELGIDEYVKSLTGAGLHSVLSNAERTTVETVAIPKFKFDYDIEMKNVLEAMSMKRAFDMVRADFTKLGTVPPGFNLYISRVLHKTFIEVDELGTKAGAVTAVEVSSNGSPAPPEDPKRVILDRPFVFMIVDNAQNLPVFIGVVNSI
jgi:serpin B